MHHKLIQRHVPSEEISYTDLVEFDGDCDDGATNVSAANQGS